MIDYNQTYYIPMGTDIEDAPLLSWGDDNNIFIEGQPIELVEPVALTLRDPEPNNPVMVDYHRLSEAVFSDKIKNSIAPMKIKGVQLLPARIMIDEDKFYDYWYMYTYNRLADCLDLENSKYSMMIGLDKIDYMSKILLNNSQVDKISLEERLVFKPFEYATHEIFHESVVEQIMETSPVGIKFWSLTEWDDSAFFK